VAGLGWLKPPPGPTLNFYFFKKKLRMGVFWGEKRERVRIRIATIGSLGGGGGGKVSFFKHLRLKCKWVDNSGDKMYFPLFSINSNPHLFVPFFQVLPTFLYIILLSLVIFMVIIIIISTCNVL
jgi:hypothetical protein